MILALSIVLVVAILVVLFLLGLLAPRTSRRRQAAVDRDIDQVDRGSEHAPAPINRPLDRWLQRFRKAADKSSEAGREAHRG